MFFYVFFFFFFFQAEDGIRDIGVTGVQTCALPISGSQFVQVLRGLQVVLRTRQERAHTDVHHQPALNAVHHLEIGRASCREECRSRGWPYHEKKKKESEMADHRVASQETTSAEADA